MSRIVFVNGSFVPFEQAQVPIMDRGFLFADGVYEVIRACDGAMFAGEAHLERLRQGLQALEIRLTEETQVERLLEVAEHLLGENGLLEGDATVYLQVTRGAAPRMHQFPTTPTRPTVYVSAARFSRPPELHEKGTQAITHPDIRWARCHIKTVNLLGNVLAKQHAIEAGATEAILLREGVVTEGSHSNVVGVLDGEIRTAPLSHYILPGITRALILDLARELGYAVREVPILSEELPRLQELFLTGTTTDVMPVVLLDGRPVGEGTPGPVTRALQQAYAAKLQGQPQRAPAEEMAAVGSSG